MVKCGRSHSCSLCLVSLQERSALDGKLELLRLGGDDTGVKLRVGKGVQEDFALYLGLDGISHYSAQIGRGRKNLYTALGLLLRL